MRITSIEVIPLSYMKRTPFVRRSFAIVRVRTDTPLVGYGEASDCYGHQTPLVIKAIVDEELSRFLLGEDPFEIERLVVKMRGRVGRFLGHHGAVCQAISGIEIALWDLVGKARGEPIYRLLGGAFRDRIPLYAGGTIAFDKSPEWHHDFYRAHLEHGFRALKVRVGSSPQWDREIVCFLRQVVGDNVALIADAASNYTADTAIQMAHAFEPYQLLYLEEPIPDYDLESMSRVVSESRLPIAYGEHVSTAHGFRDLIIRRAADILQPDATVCGGLLEAKKICWLADTWGFSISPHCGGLTAIGIAANLHLAATLPRLMFLEYDGASDEEQMLRDKILPKPILDLEHIQDGCLPVPTGPGLGLEIDESAFAYYPYEPRGPEPAMPVYGVSHL